MSIDIKEWKEDTVKSVATGEFVEPIEGLCVFEDDKGLTHLWPSIKTQDDIEKAMILFSMSVINVKTVYLHERDYEFYHNHPKEAMVLQ